MKKVIFILSLVFVLGACSSDDDNLPNNNKTNKTETNKTEDSKSDKGNVINPPDWIIGKWDYIFDTVKISTIEFTDDNCILYEYGGGMEIKTDFSMFTKEDIKDEKKTSKTYSFKLVSDDDSLSFNFYFEKKSDNIIIRYFNPEVLGTDDPENGIEYVKQ